MFLDISLIVDEFPIDIERSRANCVLFIPPRSE
jgi:hypothetical protein